MRLPYADPRVALATLHGKAEALAPALAPLGFRLETIAVDTDALGTFAGDIARPGTAHEVVIEKARRGMAASGLKLGIATEGSFGPDPLLGFLPLHTELLAFVDDALGQTVVIEHAGHDTNWVSKAIRPGDDLAPVLAAIGLPTHAALVKPNRWSRSAGECVPVAKELKDSGTVAEAVADSSEVNFARAFGPCTAIIESSGRSCTATPKGLACASIHGRSLSRVAAFTTTRNQDSPMK